MRNRLLPFQGPRLIFFSGVMFCTFLVLIIRLYEFQVTDYASFKAQADENSIQSVPLPAPRGVIYDRSGTPLALNAPAFNVSITPAYLPDDDAQTLDVLNRLSALIDVPATRAAADAAGKRNVRSLQELVAEGQGIAPYRAVIVATDIKQETAQIILEDIQNLPGVAVQTASVRQYPSGSTTAQIIGYLGPVGADEAKALRKQGYDPRFERVGYAGVEAYLEKDLAGQRGFLTQTVDVAGLPINVIKRNEPVAGKNVRLTIDLALQQFAEQALSDRINIINAAAQKLQTVSGVVIAMNPKTGEILALVSLPTYDNTRFARQIDGDYFLRIAQEAQTPLVDHATQSQYPPGSVWKLVTSTGVLEEKVIPVDAKLYDPGYLIVENTFAKNDTAQRQRFFDWLRTGHGAVDLIRGIAWSCDVYFYQVGGGNPDPKVSSVLRPGGLGIEDMYRYATALGVGVDTGIELPYEASGRMPDRTWKRRNYGESWSTGDTYNAAFGQGYITVSPLQLVSAVASIINDGTYYQPTLIKDWLDSEGNLIQPFKPQVDRTIALPADGSPAVLNMHEDMLVQGKNSLSCVCEAASPYRDPTNPEYDPNLPQCTQDFINNYKHTVNLTGRGEITYTVHVPYNYTFGGVCNQFQINDAIYQNYQPPFVSLQNLKYIQEGMREAVTIAGGTSPGVALGYVDVAGKTGTAEYCDNIAAPLGLCIQGQWPSHAWFVGYAPFENPEIIAIAFVYNAGEGSTNALPIIKNVLNCYFTLKSERAQLGENAQIPPCTSLP